MQVDAQLVISSAWRRRKQRVAAACAQFVYLADNFSFELIQHPVLWFVADWLWRQSARTCSLHPSLLYSVLYFSKACPLKDSHSLDCKRAAAFALKAFMMSVREAALSLPVMHRADIISMAAESVATRVEWWCRVHMPLNNELSRLIAENFADYVRARNTEMRNYKSFNTAHSEFIRRRHDIMLSLLTTPVARSKVEQLCAHMEADFNTEPCDLLKLTRRSAMRHLRACELREGLP